MAVVLGKAVLQNGVVSITPPEGGFGGVEAVRVSNFTNDSLIITNIDTDRPGQQYLLPFQQAVYPQKNVRTPPTIQAVVLGTDFSTEAVLVEWSTEPLNDFPGTYPQTLVPSTLTSGIAAPAFEVHGLTVADDGATHTIAAEPRRVSLTFINTGGVDLEWSHADTAWPRPLFASGSARTVDTTAAVYFRVHNAGGGAGGLQWFETRYGAGVVT